jgi:hypothetical protein
MDGLASLALQPQLQGANALRDLVKKMWGIQGDSVAEIAGIASQPYGTLCMVGSWNLHISSDLRVRVISLIDLN